MEPQPIELSSRKDDLAPLLRAGKQGRWREVLRQWILLVPLLTSTVGAAATHLAVSNGNEDYVDYLPAIFFVGALLVTAAMLHQRRTLGLILNLAQRLQGAKQRLDVLHDLSLALNQSLDTSQTSQTLLEHTLQLMRADAGAIWVRSDFVPLAATRDLDQREAKVRSQARAPERRAAGVEAMQEPAHWRRITALGFETAAHFRVLDGWDAALQDDETAHDERACRVAGAPDFEALCSLLSRDEAAVSQPIVWENQIIGAMLVCSRERILNADEAVLLREIAPVGGSALHQALLYGIATERAELDGLTQLSNHRAIQERLAQEITRLGRARLTQPNIKFSLAMMDLTDFKLFNDTYGHATGDGVLRLVGDALRQTFRLSDCVGRYGGDEFVVLLPDTDAESARKICARAIEAVKARPFAAKDGSPITIRLACGVASYPFDGQSGADLLHAADARLYETKRRGELLAAAPSEVDESPDSAEARPDWTSVGLLGELMTAIDKKDRTTKQHCENVWKYATLLASEMELPHEMVQAAAVCSLVQDVGKIALPDALLRKPGRLNAAEREIMQNHPVLAALIVRDVPHLDLVLAGVRHHHESFNGAGYPDHLKGEEIPLLARVLSVADAFAAMTSQRPHRPALSGEDALHELQQGAGTQFDPAIVEVFARALNNAGQNKAARPAGKVTPLVPRTAASGG